MFAMLLGSVLQGAKLQYGHVPVYESGENPNAKQFQSLHAVQVCWQPPCRLPALPALPPACPCPTARSPLAIVYLPGLPLSL